MFVKFNIGSGWEEVDLPENTIILGRPELQALPNVGDHFQWIFHRRAFGEVNLSDLIKNKKNVCVLIHSLTHSFSAKDFLSPLIHALKEASLSREKITILIAAGPYGEISPDQFPDIFGEYVLSNAILLNHDPDNEQEHGSIGEIQGIPTFLNRRFLEAELKIIAGPVPLWSQSVLDSLETIYLGLFSSATLLAFLNFGKKAHAGKSKSPIEKTDNSFPHGDSLTFLLRAVYQQAPADYMISFTAGANDCIGSIFCGSPTKSYEKACQHTAKHHTISVKAPADIIITGSVRTQYFSELGGVVQVLKAMKPKGTIIYVAGAEKPNLTKKKYHEILEEWHEKRCLEALKNYKILSCNSSFSSPFPSYGEKKMSLEEAVKKACENLSEEKKIYALPEYSPVTLATEEEEPPKQENG